MDKRFKNIKVSTTIIFLSVIAVFFSLLIGALGIVATNKVNHNVTIMYNDELLPIVNIANMRKSYLTIGLSCTNADISYHDKYAEDIKRSDEEVIKNYKEYTSTHSDKTEEKYLNAFSENYKNYLNIAKNYLIRAKNGKKLTPNENNKLIEIGNKVETALDELQKYDIKYAREDNIKSDEIYKFHKNLLIILLVVCSIVLFLISTVIIKSLKRYLKEIDGILKEVATGNLDVEVKSDGKNEFEVMKSYIQKTVDSFGDMIGSLKFKIEAINSSSEDLSAVSEEMASSTENISTAIEDVAKGTGEQAENLVDITNILDGFGDSIRYTF